MEALSAAMDWVLVNTELPRALHDVEPMTPAAPGEVLVTWKLTENFY